MSLSGAEKVMRFYFDSDWTFTKKDALRIDISIDPSPIYFKGTPIGYIKTIDAYDADFFNIMVLSLQNFKSCPGLTRVRKSLLKVGNKYGLPVVFVDAIDIGFGEPPTQISVEHIYEQSLRVADLSEYTPDKKNVIAMSSHYYSSSLDDVKTQRYYIVTQNMNDDIYTPTYFNPIDLISTVKSLFDKECQDKGYDYYFLKEPKNSEMNKIIEKNCISVTYGMVSKQLDYYLETRDKLQARVIKNKNGIPIIYKYIPSIQVIEYFKDKENKQ